MNHLNATPDALRPRTRILKLYEGHGAYIWHLDDFYFLAAAELNRHLKPGTSFDDPDARLRAATQVIMDVEIEPKAMTSLGSFRFDDPSEYRRHRRALTKAIRLFRRASRLKERVEAMVQ